MLKNKQFENSLKTLSSEEVNHVSGGLIGPDGDLNQFPRRFWPVIQPVQNLIDIKAVVSKVAVR